MASLHVISHNPFPFAQVQINSDLNHPEALHHVIFSPVKKKKNIIAH